MKERRGSVVRTMGESRRRRTVAAGAVVLALSVVGVVGTAGAAIVSSDEALESQTGLEIAAPVPVGAPVVRVDGQPFPGEGEGAKIPGCGFSLSVEGLPGGDPASAIAVAVSAVAPSVPEGQELQLVDETFLVSTTEWSHDVDVTGAVQSLAPKPNGHRLQLTISIDGVEVGSRVYWVACGEPQQGHPTRILFDVEWRRLDGTVVTDPPDDLPDGWWNLLVLEGQSERGTATCTFDASLQCTYDNPGHGDQPGLVVPGNPRATYDVSISGVPSGWTVDPATIGTFVGRETCPRGGDHDEGEHETLRLAAHEDEEEQPRTCTHLVGLVEQPLPDTTPPMTAGVATTSEVAVDDVLGTASARSDQLPRTGVEAGMLFAFGLALVTLGALLTALARRRHGGEQA
jgi:hypothetical protein